MPQDSLDHKSMRQSVISLRVQGIGDEVLRRGGEFILHIIEHREEVFDRADAGEHVGMGAPLDQFFEPRPRTIKDGRDGQPLLLSKDSGQFGRVGCRRAVRE